MAHLLRLHHGPCGDWKLPRRPALTVVNPPWGQRLLSDRAAADDGGGGDGGYDGRGRGRQQEQLAGPDPGLVDAWKQLAGFFKVSPRHRNPVNLMCARLLQRRREAIPHTLYPIPLYPGRWHCSAAQAGSGVRPALDVTQT